MRFMKLKKNMNSPQISRNFCKLRGLILSHPSSKPMFWNIMAALNEKTVQSKIGLEVDATKLIVMHEETNIALKSVNTKTQDRQL